MIEWTLMDKKDINDKSKADVFANALAVIQLTWFLMHCIARFVEHLRLTELEVITISFAFLNIIIYGFWWHKPTRVDRPIVIINFPDDQKLEYSPNPNPNPCPSPNTGGRDDEQFWLIGLFDGLVNFTFRSRAYNPASKEVPMLWAGESIRDSRSAYAITSVLAIVYGAIHFIAWNYPVPSHHEALLWKISSVILVVSPFFYLATFSTILWKCPKYLKIIVEGATAMMIPIYFFGRISSLGLALMSLRALPDSAFQTSTWLTAFLHI